MSTLQQSLFGLLLLLAFFSTTFAQTTTAAALSPSTPTASSTYNVFSAIASSSPPQDYTNDPSTRPDDNPAPPNPNAAGASGASQTAITLNSGDVIAISVVVGLVVLLGIASAVLFYLAKKRQWEVRASLRRSAKRVTTAIRAKTPVREAFSRTDRERIDKPRVGKNKNHTPEKSKRSGGILRDGKGRSEKVDTAAGKPGMDRDVEKGFDQAGFGTQTKVEALPPKSSSSSARMVPKSSFEMDSPLTGAKGGKGKMGGKGGWMKMLGRK